MNGIVGNACADCVHFTQYYTVKCFHNFEPAECGFCDLQNRIAKVGGTCESFCKRKYERLTAEEVDKLISVLTDLKELL